MTRGLLAIALTLTALVVGLATALISAHNHSRADRLAQLQRRLEMQRAANDQSEASAAAHVWGRADQGTHTLPLEAVPSGDPEGFQP